MNSRHLYHHTYNTRICMMYISWPTQSMYTPHQTHQQQKTTQTNTQKCVKFLTFFSLFFSLHAHFMKNGICCASKKSIYIDNCKINDKMHHSADEQSIADFLWKIGGKSGLHGTAYRLMTGRGNPTIRATVTNRLNSSETGNLYAQQLQIGPLYMSHVGDG